MRANHVVSLVAGFVFAIGLAISGMTRPDAVVAFLDLGGAWDPTLAFVMGGAIAVYAPLYRLAMRRRRPLFSEVYRLPIETKIDRRLVIGSVLFGMGWGLAGFCPGPAIVSSGAGVQAALVFAAAMLAAWMMHAWWQRISLARGQS